MQCPHCGRQITDGARFCPICGKNVPTSAPMQQAQYVQQAPQQNNRYPQQGAYHGTQMVGPSPQMQQQGRQPQMSRPQGRQPPMQQQGRQPQMSRPQVQQPPMQQPPMQQQPMRQPPMQQGMQARMPQQVPPYASGNAGKGLAITSLVLGILGMVGSLIVYPLINYGFITIITMVLGIAGIATACMARSRGFKNALSMGALVCSILATTASVIFFIFIYAMAVYMAMGQTS